MKNFKLNALEKESLSQREMNNAQGGKTVCGCACYYADRGGSNTVDNGNANMWKGKHSVDENGKDIDHQMQFTLLNDFTVTGNKP